MWHKQKQENNNKKQDIIVDLLRKAKQDGRGMCVSLIGAWGVGKTHRWETDIKSCFKGNEVIYISGFGKTTLSEFKLELLDKLLKAKGWLSKFFTGLLITAISVFIIAGVVFNITGGIENRHWFWITLGVITIISLVGAISFYTSLVKYFSNKILGVDHNNIDFKHVWKSKKKPVLCFDDIERVVFSENISGILGFVEELKNIGYPILLITNPTKDVAGMWKKFKEKVVNRTFEQLPVKETFDKVVAKYQLLDDIEKEYLEKIFSLWSTTSKNEELVDKEDFQIIFEQIKSNFRLLEAIINNILFVKPEVADYDKLDKNIKFSLLSYIGLYTVIKFLEITEEQINKGKAQYIDDYKDTRVAEIQHLYNEVVTGEQILNYKDPKRFGNMVVIQGPILYDKLVPIKELLDSGYVSSQIIFMPVVSETEKTASGFSVFYSRTPDIKFFVSKLEHVMSTDKKPFSSINSMSNILTNLCICYECLGKTFNKTDFDWLLQIMNKTIQQENLPLDSFINKFNQLIRLSGVNDDSYHYYAGEYLNEMYVKYGINNLIKKVQESLAFWDETVSSFANSKLEHIIYLYVLYKDKNKQQELYDMKKSDYRKYIDIMNYLTVSINHPYSEETKQIISDSKVDFISKLKKLLKRDIKSITKLPNSGFAEHNISRGLLKQIG